MKDLRSNIKLEYLYRDAGNYKIYGNQIFPNPDNIKLEDIERRMKSVLIDGEYFDPVKWGVEPLGFQDQNEDLDHFWNEFNSVSLSNEPSTADFSITELIKKLAER